MADCVEDVSWRELPDVETGEYRQNSEWGIEVGNVLLYPRVDWEHAEQSDQCQQWDDEEYPAAGEHRASGFWW